MKNRLYTYIILGLYICLTIAFVFYLWQLNAETRLSAFERKALSDMGSINLVGDSHFPPLSYTDTEGQYSGYEADLVSAIENWLDIPVEYEQILWSSALEDLSEGSVTGVTGMRITEERAKTYHFSDPYWQTAYCLVNYIGRDYERLLGSRRFRAVMQEDSATYDYFMENLYREGIEVVLVENASEGFLILKEGYADIWFENYQVARFEALKARMLDYFNFHLIEESTGHYAIALGPDYGHLVPVINKALIALRENGTMTDLDRKWFGLTNVRAESSPLRVALPVGIYAIFSLLTLFLLLNRALQVKVGQKTEELRKSEEKFKASFEGAHDAIIISDQEGKIIDCNQNAVSLFGYNSKEGLITADQNDLSPPRQPGDNDSQLLYSQKFHAAVNYKILLRFEWIHLRQNGSTFPAEVSLTVFTLDDNKVVQANISDITERKKIQEQLEFLSLRDQLTGLYNRTFFETELLRLSKGRYYPITLISCDLDGLKLINDTMGHETGDRLLNACARILNESLRGSDILARVGGDEFCAILPHTGQLDAENIARRIRAALNHYNSEHSDLPLGLSIGLATAEDGSVKLKDLFSQADDLMYRDKLYRSGSVRNKVVQSLLAALAERDYITEGHAQRLEELCLAIGEKVSLTSRQLTDLALLAKVHDLGKVGIPDSILNKPGTLDPDEWEIMKQHSEKGFRIATSSPDLAGVADLILKHHERWDGSGYPLGLAGDEIPIECRILAIVDAYDAMTNERPYSIVKSSEEALTEIINCTGKQFDPCLTKIFASILNHK